MTATATAIQTICRTCGRTYLPTYVHVCAAHAALVVRIAS